MAPWTTTPLTRLSSHLTRQKSTSTRSSSSSSKVTFLPITLAFITSFLIIMYVSFTFEHHTSLFIHNKNSSFVQPSRFKQPGNHHDQHVSIKKGSKIISTSLELPSDHARNINTSAGADPFFDSYVSSPPRSTVRASGSSPMEDVYHDREIFIQNYEEMKRSLKIYIYPTKKNDPFANALLPVDDQEPGGNYASETYFKNVLFKSHFITNDPSEADLFFLPFSIARLRHDRRVGVAGLADFVKGYMANISRDYPYWNHTGGADHFYVACHSITKLATEKVDQVKTNAIQVTCSSSYFLQNYFAHKDVCLPQIWPRHEELPNLASTKNRKKLAFFAGTMISPVRKAVVQAWSNDTSIFVNSGRLKTPYSEQLLGSKYCLHVKGFEVNTARIGDSMYYGCVPVILADYYDLPFMDILNWRSFSVVVTTSDIPNLKKILEKISPKEYSVLQANVLKVRKHFQWYRSPLDFDAFYMTMYELWLRRSSIRVLS